MVMPLKPHEMLFKENSSSATIVARRRILNENLIPYVCAICSIPPVWNEKPMSLVLDHINGVDNDHRLENLRFICNNCDTQLPTFKGRNKKSNRAKLAANMV